MKRIATLVLCAWFLGGCATSSDWTEATLGDGRYEINSANSVRMVGNTNNPTLYVAECGSMWVEVRPLLPGAASEIWVDWLGGGSHGVIAWSNDSRVITFDLQPTDGAAPGTTEIETEYGGACDITLTQTNGSRMARFTVWSDGTNAYLTLNSQGASPAAEFMVKTNSSGVYNLHRVTHEGAEQENR